MKMFKLLIASILLLGTSLQMKSQNIPASEVQAAIDIANIEYRDFIKYYFEVDKKVEVKFWDQLNEYLKDRGELWKEDINIFSKDLSQMDDEKSKDFLKEVLKLDKKKTNVKNKHFRKIGKTLSPKQYLRFIQIDHYIESARAFKFASETPWTK
jgi:hypothetical protein